MVPLVTSQRAPVRTCFLTNRAAGNPVLLEISLKGTFLFLHAEPFFFFLNRWSRDISVFSRLGSTSACFFVSSERFAPSRGSSLCCRSYASLPLTAVCGSELSAFTPDDIRVDNTHMCNTRLVSRRPVVAEKQLWRPSVRSYTLNTAGMPADLGGRGGGVGSRSEDKDGIFEGNRWN